jgi:hypothetical protein
MNDQLTVVQFREQKGQCERELKNVIQSKINEFKFPFNLNQISISLMDIYVSGQENIITEVNLGFDINAI